MKPLFIPLNTEYFYAFKHGEKTVEWRIYGPRWNEKTCTVGRPVIISKGYGRYERLQGVVTGFSKQQIDDPGHAFNRVFGDMAIGAIAACIHITVDRLQLPGFQIAKLRNFANCPGKSK